MRKTEHIGVIGAGSMGAGIAQVAATAGCKVTLFDQQKSAAISALDKLSSILDRLVEKERISNDKRNDILSLITIVDDLNQFHSANS